MILPRFPGPGAQAPRSPTPARDTTIQQPKSAAALPTSDTLNSLEHSPLLESREALFEVMGASALVAALAREIELVARTPFSVLLLGETGSGKEVAARAIHAQSERRRQRFMAVDCGSISESLLESELFGHERGAFTGAHRQSTGIFKAAAGGTLFLDEVSSMSPGMQGKLLRVLEDKSYYRVGTTQAMVADVRVIAASNRELDPSRSGGAFRSDLYFRLAEYEIRLPPLRLRRDDIPHLARRFVRSTSVALGRSEPVLASEALERLSDYAWPGNARELHNVLRRAVLLAADVITPELLGPASGARPAAAPAPATELAAELARGRSLRDIVQGQTDRIEREVLAQALAAAGTIAEVARMLQADYKTIHVKARKYGLLAPRGASRQRARLGGSEAPPLNPSWPAP